MKFENEITVEINTDLNNLISILENNNFKLKEEYDVKDIYMINKTNKSNDYLEMLNKAILIRDIIETDKETKQLTYKYKEYNENKEITKQGKINCKIDSISSAVSLFEKLEFEQLITINDHLSIYANENDELAIQSVNDKHIYIEIEDTCYYINRNYNSIEEMKEVIKKYEIPIKNNNYFAKKAEIELRETYKKQRN